MFDHRIIVAARRFLFGVVMLALALTPVQSIGSFAATDGMALASMAEMPSADCPQKQSCCDKEKSECPSMQTCVAPFNGRCMPTNVIEAELIEFGPAVMTALIVDQPDSMASLPLRRPPRA